MLIYLDIAMTGFEQEDKMCALGCVVFENGSCVRTFYELVKEGKKVSALASSKHNITNEMLENKPTFLESEIYKFLQKENREENSLIVHNAGFVLKILEFNGFKFKGKIIDTFKVVKHLIPECEIFTLEYLRYELRLYKEEQQIQNMCGIKDALVSHNALANAVIIKLLYDYFLSMTTEEQMHELSFKSVLLEKFNFGKYVGKYIEDIALNDRGYLLWMLNLENLDEDLEYSIKYYLEEVL